MGPSDFTQHRRDLLVELFSWKLRSCAVRGGHRGDQNSFNLVSPLGVFDNEEGKEVPEVVVAASGVPSMLPESAAHSGSFSDVVGNSISIENVDP